LRVRLLLVIPAVENGIGPNAFRPGDVLATRAGLTVEVTNTDAEGRLVLADALAYAGEANPELTIDFATLTGAARVALGPDLPALYGNDPGWVRSAVEAAEAVADPLWPMPLWDGYEDELGSKVADLQNASSSGFAGSVTAALFLRRFAPVNRPWLHLDLYAWSPRDRPGRPSGASAQTVRAVYELLRRRYGLAAASLAPVARAER
jgi:leucyl aminopeptidase